MPDQLAGSLSELAILAAGCGCLPGSGSGSVPSGAHTARRQVRRRMDHLMRPLRDPKLAPSLPALGVMALLSAVRACSIARSMPDCGLVSSMTFLAGRARHKAGASARHTSATCRCAACTGPPAADKRSAFLSSDSIHTVDRLSLLGLASVRTGRLFCDAPSCCQLAVARSQCRVSPGCGQRGRIGGSGYGLIVPTPLIAVAERNPGTGGCLASLPREPYCSHQSVVGADSPMSSRPTPHCG